MRFSSELLVRDKDAAIGALIFIYLFSSEAVRGLLVVYGRSPFNDRDS
jgi:hypothetical protein